MQFQQDKDNGLGPKNQGIIVNKAHIFLIVDQLRQELLEVKEELRNTREELRITKEELCITKEELSIFKEENRRLKLQIAELTHRKGSNNSSLPPFMDINRTPKSLRQKSNKKSGGQKGHEGKT